MGKDGEEGEAAGDFNCLFVLFCLFLVILVIVINEIFKFRNESGLFSSFVMLKCYVRENKNNRKNNNEGNKPASALPSTSTIYSSEPKLKKPGSPPFPLDTEQLWYHM